MGWFMLVGFFSKIESKLNLVVKQWSMGFRRRELEKEEADEDEVVEDTRRRSAGQAGDGVRG